MAIERKQAEGAPKRVLLVGWDAADWQMIHPLIEQGLMPTTAALMERGAWGNLATLRPILSPILWNFRRHGKACPAAWRLRFHRAGPGWRPGPAHHKHQPQVQGAVEYPYPVRPKDQCGRLVRLAPRGAH